MEFQCFGTSMAKILPSESLLVFILHLTNVNTGALVQHYFQCFNCSSYSEITWFLIEQHVDITHFNR